MEQISELIQRARQNDSEGDRAVARLVTIGMPAVPAIIEEIRQSSMNRVLEFSEVLWQIQDPEIVPVMIELLDDKSIDLQLAAFRALGALQDQRALQPLLDQLNSHINSHKSLAAQALGNLRYPEAIKGLLNLAQEVVGDPYDSQAIHKFVQATKEEYGYRIEANPKLEMLLDVIVALAKLGNHELAPIAISLTSYGFGEEDEEPDDAIVRNKAVEALQYVVGLGMFTALKKALRAGFGEPQKALNAMFYLGVKETLEELILHVEDDWPPYLASNAYLMIYRLTGEWPKGEGAENINIEDLKDWWKQRESGFDSNVCYRLGKPLYIPDIIECLKDSRFRRDIIEELRMITGNGFGFNIYISHEKQEQLWDRAQDWWQEEGHRFETGCLYKYGHKQNINNIF